MQHEAGVPFFVDPGDRTDKLRDTRLTVEQVREPAQVDAIIEQAPL
jgi:hypothetical protein